MERSNASGTITSLSEGSGNSYVTTSFQNFTYAYTTLPERHVINNVKRGSGNTKSWINLDTTRFEMETTSQADTKDMDSAALLQTNILLIAVLVVCFITLTSVIAMCTCFLRRYCKKRRIPHSSSELYQTTLVSKTTSVTGLNAAHLYYSTKVEKKTDFSSNLTSPNKCEKAIACELGTGRIVESCPSILAANFEPKSPTCPTQTEEPAPIYFKMKDILTSTPASTHPQHINDYNISQSVVSSPVPKLIAVSSAGSPPSLYTSAYSDQKSATPNSQQPLQPNSDPASNHVGVRCLTKGPSTQSVSWFVPLNGVQREPLRHSVVELNDEEVNIEHIYQHLGSIQGPLHQQYIRAGKLRTIPYEGGITLKEELEDAERKTATSCDLQLQDFDDQAMNSTAEAENVPLVKSNDDKSTNPGVQSLPTKRVRLKSTMSEDQNSPEDEIFNGRKTRSRSLSSPEENSMWQQREDRPVLFLGSGIK